MKGFKGEIKPEKGVFIISFFIAVTKGWLHVAIVYSLA